MKSNLLKLTVAAAAFASFAGIAMADGMEMHMQLPNENFAAKPGCGTYGPCYRADQNVRPYGLTTSGPGEHAARDAGLVEMLSTHGYRQGYEVYNVIDSIH